MPRLRDWIPKIAIAGSLAISGKGFLAICPGDVFADEIAEGDTLGSQVVSGFQEGIDARVHVADNSADGVKTRNNLSAIVELCLAKIPYLGELAPGGLQIILAVAMAS